MRQKYFAVPFAFQGDLGDDISNDIEPSGKVSYPLGFGYDYSRDKDTDPLAKPVPRDAVNRILNQITAAVQQIQQWGYPEFITAADNGGTPFAYGKGATVVWSASGTPPFGVYVSNEDNNATAPGDANSKWLPQQRAFGNIPALAAAPATNVSDVIYVPGYGIMEWKAAYGIYRTVDCGRISLEPWSAPQTGYIEASGQVIAKAAQPGLWSKAQETGRVVTPANWTHFTPNYADIDATSFRVPDMRGIFFRAWDKGKGFDTGRSFGTYQAGQVQAHKHVVPTGENSTHTPLSYFPWGYTSGQNHPGIYNSDNDNRWLYSNDGSNYEGTVNAAGVIGAETRGPNTSLLAVIHL